MNTWILCANLWGARLFSTDHPDEAPRFVREFPRPKTFLRHEDFDTDEDIPELMENPDDRVAEERVAHRFMGDLACFIEGQCERNSFDQIVLCAEGQLLSILDQKLGPCTLPKVTRRIEEDLYEVNETDLVNYIRAA